MIISASRRTDIPAYYADWFMNRVRSGYCDVANPFNSRIVSRVSLAPADVDVIVFWTRNAAPLLPHLDELDGMGYRYYFQYTLVQYPACLEPNTTLPAARIATFRKLAERLGPERVVWRYDPVILSNITPPDFHQVNFAELARSLRGYTQRCVVSLLDLYAGTRRRMNALRSEGVSLLQPSRSEASDLLAALSRMAGDNGMEVFTCAEPEDFSDGGAPAGRCIDNELIERVFGMKLPDRKDPHQRKACRCVISRDVGAYNTCPAGCIYCYATGDIARAETYFRNHDSLGARL